MLGYSLVTLLCVPLVRSTQVYRFGTPDNLGTDQHEPDGSPDFLLWRSENLPDGPFPSQFTLCFSMFYTALDYWSANQKTLLRIFQVENSDHFWMRVNHSPPRGTMIMNRANLWSGGLGDFRSDMFHPSVSKTVIITRYEDNAFLRWSSICHSVDFTRCWVKYYIDGRKVADQKLVPTWADLCAGREPPWPSKVTKIAAGQNMVGYLTNINVHSRVLQDQEMLAVIL